MVRDLLPGWHWQRRGLPRRALDSGGGLSWRRQSLARYSVGLSFGQSESLKFVTVHLYRLCARAIKCGLLQVN
jgi:hypothetical protein